MNIEINGKKLTEHDAEVIMAALFMAQSMWSQSDNEPNQNKGRVAGALIAAIER